jgi:hypothetical protein
MKIKRNWKDGKGGLEPASIIEIDEAARQCANLCGDEAKARTRLEASEKLETKYGVFVAVSE